MHELAPNRVDSPASELVDDIGFRARDHAARFRTFQDSGKTFRVGRAILGNMEATLNARVQPLAGMQKLILLTAAIGFAFDIYEVVVQALVLRPVLMELGGLAPGSREFNHWAGLMLFMPVVVGGLASLGGGWLTDRFGRQRVLVWSILLYGTAAFLSGLATSLAELIVWRCITVAGAIIEYVAAIAWLTEMFTDGRRRDRVLGWAQACGTLGNFMMAGAYYAFVTWGDSLPAVHGAHSAWRYMFFFGALPALPVAILRPFLPESPVWIAKRAAGTLRRPSFRELFTPRLRRVTLLATALVAFGYCIAFGLLQHIPRLVPSLAQVAHLPPRAQEQWVSIVHLFQDFGGVAGRVALALLVSRLVVRGPIYRWAMAAALVSVPLMLLGPAVHDAVMFGAGAAVLAGLMALQHSFWGNYLPRLFPVHLRGTGESFAIGIGGRVIAPFAAIATTQLANAMPGATPSARLAVSMAVVTGTAVLCGFLLSWRLPEPAADLPED
jgi:MFS family permease